MAKTIQEFDIKKVFADTKEALQKNIDMAQGRIDMVAEIEQYFEANNLKVVQEVEVPDTEPEQKTK